jgi:hypothetical protein
MSDAPEKKRMEGSTFARGSFLKTMLKKVLLSGFKRQFSKLNEVKNSSE